MCETIEGRLQRIEEELNVNREGLRRLIDIVSKLVETVKNIVGEDLERNNKSIV